MRRKKGEAAEDEFHFCLIQVLTRLPDFKLADTVQMVKSISNNAERLCTASYLSSPSKVMHSNQQVRQDKRREGGREAENRARTHVRFIRSRNRKTSLFTRSPPVRRAARARRRRRRSRPSHSLRRRAEVVARPVRPSIHSNPTMSLPPVAKRNHARLRRGQPPPRARQNLARFVELAWSMPRNLSR